MSIYVQKNISVPLYIINDNLRTFQFCFCDNSFYKLLKPLNISLVSYVVCNFKIVLVGKIVTKSRTSNNSTIPFNNIECRFFVLVVEYRLCFNRYFASILYYHIIIVTIRIRQILFFADLDKFIQYLF